MYEVKEIIDQQYSTYELIDSTTHSWVKVAPERGGLIYSYGIEGQEILYLNEETFYDIDKNVRGGIPFLFPISGQLPNQSYMWEEKEYFMTNHGFARNATWEVISTNDKKRASLIISFSSNEETKLSYPFDFIVILEYILENGKLIIQQKYKNMSNRSMPIYAGFHPYFKIKEKNISYETDALRYFDYNDGKEKKYTGALDLSDSKEPIVLLDIKQNNISFPHPILERNINLKYKAPFKYVVLWTEKDKEFICVEPWMACNNEFERQTELVMIESNDTLVTEFSIELEN